LLLNDILILEVLTVLVLLLYTTNTNLLVLLSLGGVYLLTIGVWLLVNEGDIYTGFLWVIDLGVGLVFLIFILHFTSFFFQKSNFNLTARYYIIFGLFILTVLPITYLFGDSLDSYNNSNLNKVLSYKVTWLDYYTIYISNEVTELNTLKENYFFLNSYPFYIINFNLFFGLMIVILLYFLVQRFFVYLNFSETHHFNVLKSNQSSFFIRSQNFIRQQNTFPSLYS